VSLWKSGSTLAWRFDDAVVDGLVNGAARIDVFASGQLDAFDGNVVDGVVDSVGRTVAKAGAVRRMHTGNVQTYVTVFAVATVILVLVFAR